MRKLITTTGAILALVSFSQGTQAGTAKFNFDTDPTGTLTFFGNNPEPWRGFDGNPATGGYLNITDAVGSQSTVVIFPDIDAGKTVTAFKFTADIRMGNGTSDRPADGFSISYARAGDPVIETGGGFAGGPPENGTTTGIAINFDTWQGNSLPDGGDLEGIIVRVDNKTVLRHPMPVRHGACDNVNSLQTGPRVADTAGDPTILCWQKLEVDLTVDGKLTVKYKGKTLLDAFQTTFFPSPGRLVLAGRTGGANENHHVDNIEITTIASSDSQAPTLPTALKAAQTSTRRIRLEWGAATDDSGRVAYEVERDGAIVSGGLLTSASFVDAGLKPNTSYSYKVRAVDAAQNKSAFTAAISVKTAVEELVFTQGLMRWESYNDIPGVSLAGLTDSPKFPDSPDQIRVVSGYEGPTNVADNYGARVSGFITPQETGTYIFYMATDDNGELYLSTDDKPANKVLIASEPTWNPARAWTATARRGGCPDFCENISGPIRLEAGKRYYTELLYKEGGGGDNGAVTMIRQGDPAPAGAAPVGGNLVGSFVDPKHGPPVIAKQPATAVAAAGGVGTFSVTAAGTEPFTYQWQFNGRDIPGATSATLSVSNASAANFGNYRVIVSNWEGSLTSAAATLFIEGTLFIEAEDFNYDKGLYVKDKPIGMSGKYPGGAFAELGTDLDAGVDWNAPGGNAGQPYRPGTGVAAGKPNAHTDGLPRGTFSVTLNHVVGWNDGGDWYNYTRQFPEPAKSYNVIGRLSSGGNPINGQLDEVTAGAKTANQTLKKLGVFRPGRATPGWDIMEFFPLTDDSGNAVALELGGEKTLRFTTLPEANLDIDYMMFIPAAGPGGGGAGPRIASVTRDGNNIRIVWEGGGALEAADAITGPWAAVANAASPASVPISGAHKFYRLRR